MGGAVLEWLSLAPGTKRACGPIAAVLALAGLSSPLHACAAPRETATPPPGNAYGR